MSNTILNEYPFARLQDLTAWVTLGSIQIPHTEEIPNVQATPDSQLSFFLAPFNYFNSDPSLSSGDNLRVTTHQDARQTLDGVGPDLTGTGPDKPAAVLDLDCLPVMSKTTASASLPFVSWVVTVTCSLVVLSSR